MLRKTACVALVVAGLPLSAGNVLALAGAGATGPVIRFEALANVTRIEDRPDSGSCMALTLPGRWRAESPAGSELALRRGDGALLSLERRTVADEGGRSRGDLWSRDAAALQRDYESALGRPAQSFELASLPTGGGRWRATWIDGNLAGEDHALTLETLIVPLSGDTVLEVSLEDAAMDERGDIFAAIAGTMQGSVACRDR